MIWWLLSAPNEDWNFVWDSLCVSYGPANTNSNIYSKSVEFKISNWKQYNSIFFQIIPNYDLKPFLNDEAQNDTIYQTSKRICISVLMQVPIS